MKLSPGLAFMLEGIGEAPPREYLEDDQWTYVIGKYAGLLSHPSLGTMLLNPGSSLYEMANNGGVK